MIYLASDLHGEITHTLKDYYDCAGEGDLLLLLGDTGVRFWGTEENRAFDELFLSSRHDIAILDGNHENFDYFDSLPEDTWQGGKVRRLTPHVVLLSRGEIYTVNGKTFFAFGGCQSSQKWRDSGKPTYPQEAATDEQLAYAKDNLRAHGNCVDYVLTHKYEALDVSKQKADNTSRLNVYIDENITFTHWYAGHWHREIEYDATHSTVYDRLLPLNLQ